MRSSSDKDSKDNSEWNIEDLLFFSKDVVALINNFYSYHENLRGVNHIHTNYLIELLRDAVTVTVALEDYISENYPREEEIWKLVRNLSKLENSIINSVIQVEDSDQAIISLNGEFARLYCNGLISYNKSPLLKEIYESAENIQKDFSKIIRKYNLKDS